MKLSANKDDPSYHPIAYYVKVFVNAGRTELTRCKSFDTSTSDYCCYTHPMDVKDNEAAVYYNNDPTLYCEVMEDAPQELVDDWYKRELGE